MNEYFDFMSETQSVGEFLLRINSSLARHSGRVEGEVTSVKDTYPTAVYFSMKDTTSDALLNCVIWKSIYTQNGVHIKEGDQIIVTGTPEIYAARGSFSMKVNTIEYAGEGALKKAYDELRLSLEREGLLALEKKRPLPLYPKRIGVITSRSGVVIQDFSANLGRYGFQITMVDSRVEGKDAIHELLAALRTMRTQDIEVLVIMRGGGSWESLQPFNTESVVRAIASYVCPVLTGIGHDVDVTLSELVADRGASTPTAVAEALNESWDSLQSSFDAAESRVLNSFERRLSEITRTLDGYEGTVLRQFEHALKRVHANINQATVQVWKSYRSLEKIISQARTSYQKIVSVMRGEIKIRQTKILNAQGTVPKKFRYLMNQSRSELSETGSYLKVQQKRIISQTKQSLKHLEHSLTLVDPARNLRLGYSLSFTAGKIIRSIKDIAQGDTVEIKIADGSFTSDVKQVL